MTYKDQFVAEVKSNGKILRVKDDAVYLPFGSEYSILLKNLNSRRASVSISIDGDDVLDGHSLILEPDSSTELEGFLRNNTAKNRFKFINKTKQIQDHRGDKIDDGMIRIEFAYEKDLPDPLIKKTIYEVHNHYNPPIRFDYYGSTRDWTFTSDFSSGGNLCGASARDIGDNSGEQVMYASNVVCDSLGVQDMSSPLPDEGITVKGSEINQEFRYSSIGELEQSEVIVIQLRGTTASSAAVKKPITVQTKLECKTCGTKSKSSCKFCPTCGTFLE